MSKRYLYIILLFLPISSSWGDLVDDVTPELVMAGESSAFNDGAWIRVQGLIAHQNCQYGSWTLFYATNAGPVAPDKVLSIAMSAKISGKKLIIDYDSNGVSSDFWGFGISKCQIKRIALK